MALQRIRNERGTTLIQVLGATVILTIIILAFVSLSQFTTASNKDTDRRDQALLIAEQIVNEIRAGRTYTMNSSLAWDTSSPYSYNISNSLTFTKGNETLSAGVIAGIPDRNQVSIQTIMLDGTDPKLLTVNVSWKG